MWPTGDLTVLINYWKRQGLYICCTDMYIRRIRAGILPELLSIRRGRKIINGYEKYILEYDETKHSPGDYEGAGA